MKPTRRPGFTLIELLVVLAILSIVAAILFPVFAHVSERARQTTCASNLRQIGLATMQYVGRQQRNDVPKTLRRRRRGQLCELEFLHDAWAAQDH